MKITKKQLQRIIREEAKTSKYDMDKHLTPKQGKELPDALQKDIIDKEKEEKKEEVKESLRKTLRKILKEEGADCAKDYRNGTLTYDEYLDCLKRFGDDDDGGGGYSSYPRYQRKTSYVGRDANQDQIATVEAILAQKPSNFLKSILSQLKGGRGLSSKQKAIVRKIVGKVDPSAAALFERHDLKMKMRKIISEVMTECPEEGSEMPCPIKTAAEMHDAGATGDDLLHWIDLLISQFGQGPAMAEPVPLMAPPEEVIVEPDPVYDEVEELIGMPSAGGGGGG